MKILRSSAFLLLVLLLAIAIPAHSSVAATDTDVLKIELQQKLDEWHENSPVEPRLEMSPLPTFAA